METCTVCHGEGKIADIESLFKVLYTGRAKDPTFKAEVAKIESFDLEPSEYHQRAIADILETEVGHGVIQADDIGLTKLQINYFDRPQTMEITFTQLLTLKETEIGFTSTIFTRELTPDGHVQRKK